MEKKLSIDVGTNAKALRRLRTYCEKVKIQLSSSPEVVFSYDLGDDSYEETITRSFFEQICGDLLKKCTETIDKVLEDAKLKKHQIDEVVLVGGSTRIPKIREIVKSYFDGKELNFTLNPDEAVAHGATIQAAILNGQVDEDCDIVLLDVTPLSLGTKTRGDKMSVLIPRNTSIPAKNEKIYHSIEDNQTKMKVKVFEGERKVATENHFIGNFLLKDFEKMPKGEAKMMVRFELDSNSILTVTAFDVKNEENIKSIKIVQDKNRLTPDEIQKMIEEAKIFEQIDKQRLAQLKEETA